MPPHVNLERLIGAALVDRDLRAALMASPSDAASGFGLSAEELEILEAADARSLEELANYVYMWISRMPRARLATRHWIADSYPLSRAAV